MFPLKLINDLIRAKLKEIVNLLKSDEVSYKSKRRKVYNFCEYSLPIVLLRDIPEGYLILEIADDGQINCAAKLKSLDNGKKQLKKSFFK